MRTIPGFEDYIEPVQDILNDVFVPTLFGQEEPMSDALSSLFSLPPRDGGLGMVVLDPYHRILLFCKIVYIYMAIHSNGLKVAGVDGPLAKRK